MDNSTDNGTEFRQLLEKILEAARDQRIGEGQLARRAGITPESLSRMKRRGDGRLSVLARLGRIVGLRLSLVPDDDTLEALRRGEFF